MSIVKANFEELEIRDILELVEARVPESIVLDYKRDLYGRKDRDKKELLKDVSGLANGHGGHLIIGVSEIDGIANELVGIDSVDNNKDRVITQMEQIIRNGLEPSISDVRIKALEISPKKHLIVIRVPRSWNSPHRVVSQGDNRFYVRNSTGVHQPDVQELRMMFGSRENILEGALDFRTSRIRKLLSARCNAIDGAGKLFIHCVPLGFKSGLIGPSMELAYTNRSDFSPLLQNDSNYRSYNLEGVAHQRGEKLSAGYTQIFRNGCLEFAWGGLARTSERSRSSILYGAAIQDFVVVAIPRFLEGLRKLAIPAPVVVMITLEDLEGRTFSYSAPGHGFQDEYEFSDEALYLPASFIENYDSTPEIQLRLKPALDTLWNALGEPSCPNFINDQYQLSTNV